MSKDDEAYFIWLSGFKSFYTRQANMYYWMLVFSRSLTVLAGLTAIVTSAASATAFFVSGGRWVIMLSAVMCMLSTELLSKFRIRGMMGLRQNGRREAAMLLCYAYDKFEQLGDDPEAIYKLKDEIREKVRHLEEVQGKGFIDIFANFHAEAEPGLQQPVRAALLDGHQA